LQCFGKFDFEKRIKMYMESHGYLDSVSTRDTHGFPYSGSYQRLLLALDTESTNGQGWQFSNNENFCGDQEAQKIKERRREKRKKFFNFFLLDLI